jgi:uncharacterized membrane protein YccC
MVKNIPLSGSFMVISIIGFFVALFMLYNKGYTDWGVAFMVAFIVMFLASVLSLSNMELDTLRLLDRKK